METATLLWVGVSGLAVGIIIGAIVNGACSCEHEREQVAIANIRQATFGCRVSDLPMGRERTYICKTCKKVKVVKDY